MDRFYDMSRLAMSGLQSADRGRFRKFLDRMGSPMLQKEPTFPSTCGLFLPSPCAHEKTRCRSALHGSPTFWLVDESAARATRYRATRHAKERNKMKVCRRRRSYHPPKTCTSRPRHWEKVPCCTRTFVERCSHMPFSFLRPSSARFVFVPHACE